MIARDCAPLHGLSGRVLDTVTPPTMDRARTQPSLPDMAQSELGMPIIAINGAKLVLSGAPGRTRRRPRPRLHASKCASIPQHSQHCEPSTAVHVHTTVTQSLAASRPAKAATEQTRTRTRCYTFPLRKRQVPRKRQSGAALCLVPASGCCALFGSSVARCPTRCKSNQNANRVCLFAAHGYPTSRHWSLGGQAKSKVKTDNLGSRTDKGAAAPRSALHRTATIPRPTRSVSHRLSSESSNPESVCLSDCVSVQDADRGRLANATHHHKPANPVLADNPSCRAPSMSATGSFVIPLDESSSTNTANNQERSVHIGAAQRNSGRSQSAKTFTCFTHYAT